MLSGSWYSYYDHRTWTNPADVDIDHVVPLAEAWDSGARRWDTATRQRYANDLGDGRTLVAVTDNVNQSKGDQDPGTWWPTYDRCRYVANWTAVKIRWRLSVNTTEKNALVAQAARCTNITLTVTRAAITLGTTGGTATGPAAITKVVYDAPGTDSSANINGEQVMVKNTGTRGLALTGWVLKDAANHRYTFPGITLSAGATVTVHSGSGTNSTTHLYARWGHVWNNTGDTATLTRANGTTADRCTWGAGTGTISC